MNLHKPATAEESLKQFNCPVCKKTKSNFKLIQLKRHAARYHPEIVDGPVTVIENNAEQLVFDELVLSNNMTEFPEEPFDLDENQSYNEYFVGEIGLLTYIIVYNYNEQF